MIVATETGILHRMEQESPDKRFIPANEAAVCKYMKMITLPKLRDSLREMKHEVQRAAPTSPSAPACRSSAWSHRLPTITSVDRSGFTALRARRGSSAAGPPRPRRASAIARAVQDVRAAVGEVVLHALHTQLDRRVARRSLQRLPHDRSPGRVP